MANVCIKMCDSMYQLPARICCVLLMFLQGCILNHYLATYKDTSWYAWIVADLAMLVVFIVAFVISYRHLVLAKDSARQKSPIQTGSLPLGYFAWFIYSVLLAARVGVIFNDFAWMLKEEDFFGPNTLKITISLAAMIFLLLLLSHHDAVPESERSHIISELTGTVVFDVLDSVDVLDVLFEHDTIKDFPVSLGTTIIAVACINFVLPTLPLMTLSRTHYGHKTTPKEIQMLHKMLLVFLVNLPLFVIRMLLWHLLSKDISIFPVKNLIVIFLVFHDIYQKRCLELQNEEVTEQAAEEEEMADFAPHL